MPDGKRLHALDITTGRETAPSPTEIEATFGMTTFLELTDIAEFQAVHKSIAPVVADGKVSVATTNSVAVFGLLP